MIHKEKGWHGDTSELLDALRSLGLIDASVATTRPREETSRLTRSSDKTPSQNGAPRQERDQHAIDLATAPIRSKETLDTYLQTTPIAESPFQYLSPVDQKVFLSELVFDKEGLTRFPADVFEGLTVTQAYELLALFGWQAVVPALTDLRVQSSLDMLIKPDAKIPVRGAGSNR